MIVDERTYTLHSGKAGEYVEILRLHVLPLQAEILGGLMGYFRTETGVLNQVDHLRAYDSLADREVRRADLVRHPEWAERSARVRPFIVTQENRILVAASFSPKPNVLGRDAGFHI